MPRNKDGKVVLPRDFRKEDEQNLSFTGDKLQQNFDDLADIVSNTLDINGKSKLQTDIDLNGHKIKNLAKGEKIGDVALIEQVTKGFVPMFQQADKDAGKTLVLSPHLQANWYLLREGNIVSFQAICNFKKYKTVNVNFSNGESVSADLRNVGAGSWSKGEWVFLIFFQNYFSPHNPDKATIPLSADNDSFKKVDDVLNSCQMWVSRDNGHGEGIPTSQWGLLTVKSSGGPDIGKQGYVSQTYHSHDNRMYIRMKVDDRPWTQWTEQLALSDISKFYIK